MTNLSQLNHDIIFRLVLAKKLYQKGIDACKTDVDIYGFSHGIITLHDALDNFTAAIVYNLGLSLGNKTSFYETLDHITKHEIKTDPHFLLLNRNQLNRINQIRNNIKHQGITPNISQEKSIINPIVDFFKKYSLTYFGINWELISFVELIKNESIKDAMIEVEQLIDTGLYKDALDKMAIIRFQVFDEFRMRSAVTPGYYGGFIKESPEVEKWNKENDIFLSQVRKYDSHLYDATDFLEKGIDRNLMSRFRDFTPTVGINNIRDWNYILDHGHNWSEENWTKDICLFCYDFLVDAIIKDQYPNYAVRETQILTYYQIKVTSVLPIYDKDDNLIYTFNPGEERSTKIFARQNEEWEIFKKTDCLIQFHEEVEKPEVIGFFKPEDHSKIEFISTKKYAQQDDKSWKQV